MGMFFLSPEEQAAKDAEEAARLQAMRDAASGPAYDPFYVGQRESAELFMAKKLEEEKEAREFAETIKRMEEENIRWAKDNDLWDYENNRVIPDNEPIKETFVEKKLREEEERKVREQVYYNEERKGMASTGPAGTSDFFLENPELKDTSYFAPENKPTGDTRDWEEVKEDFLSGKDDGPVMHNPYLEDSLKYRDKVLEFKYGDAFTNRDEKNTSIGYNVMGVPDYYTNQYRVPYESPEGKDFVFDAPLTIKDAKKQADNFYIESLNRSLKKATTNEERAQIQKLINQGAPTFSTKADFQAYYDLGVEVYQDKKELLDQGVAEADIPFSVQSELKDALQIQEDSMAAWIFFGDGRNLEYSRDQAPKFFKEETGVADFENPFENGDVFFNTGTGWTAGSLSNYLKDPEFKVGTVKGQSYWVKAPEYETPSDFQKFTSAVFDIVSILAPQTAPLLQAGKVATQGGELEDVIKAGVGAHVSNVVGDIAGDKIIETYDNLGIPVGNLPEIQQKVIVDTTQDVLQGKSAQDSFEKNAGKALVKGGVEAVGDIIEQIDVEMGDFETPEWVEKAGDVVVAAGTAIADFVEPVVEPIYQGVKAAGDVVEPIVKDVVDVAQAGVDVVQEAVQPISDITSDVEDDILDAASAFEDTVIDPALDIAQEITEPVVDVVDDVIDTIGEEVVDPALQTVKETGQDVIDTVDDFIDAVDSPVGDVLEAGLEAGLDFITPNITWNITPSNQGMFGQTSQISSLFDDDLIKLDKMESTQEMLAPFLNLRKYG